jgi:hypothetical protein
MNRCIVKYFGNLRITRNEVVNLLKNLLFVCTLDELRKLNKSRELPSCLQLLIEALFLDMEAGHCGTMLSIIDSVF